MSGDIRGPVVAAAGGAVVAGAGTGMVVATVLQSRWLLRSHLSCYSSARRVSPAPTARPPRPALSVPRAPHPLCPAPFAPVAPCVLRSVSLTRPTSLQMKPDCTREQSLPLSPETTITMEPNTSRVTLRGRPAVNTTIRLM